jgi:creatinine amidohydrolase
MPSLTGGLIEDMTWPEVAEAAQAGLPALLSIGSTEQHGPHLPLATDAILPVGIAPPIRFGARSRALSGGGESFPGTLSLRLTTLIATISEVLLGLHRSGFRRLIVQNWHYENAGVLWEACDLAVTSAPDLRILLLENPMPDFTAEQLDELFPNGFPGWDVEHASIMETAMMLVMRPDLVRTDRIVDDEAARHPTWDVVPPSPDFIPASGVLWHPSEATAKIGHRFIAAAAARLVEAISTEFPELADG